MPAPGRPIIGNESLGYLQTRGIEMVRQRSTRLISEGRIWCILLGLSTLFCALVAANLLGFSLRSSTQFKLDVGFWGDQDLLQGV
jgi:hypothetical protein